MTFEEYRVELIRLLKDMARNHSTAKLEELANAYPEYDRRMEEGESPLTPQDFA